MIEGIEGIGWTDQIIHERRQGNNNNMAAVYQGSDEEGVQRCNTWLKSKSVKALAKASEPV